MIPEEEKINEDEFQYIGEYSEVESQFMEVEPVQVPMDIPLISPTTKDDPDDSRRPIKPVYDPGEYSYAELNAIRNKKAAARTAKIQQQQQQQQQQAMNRGRLSQSKDDKKKKGSFIYEDQFAKTSDDIY